MSQRHFEEEDHVKIYSQYRPSPPKSLLNKIVSTIKDTKNPTGRHHLAVDIGCGSGQATFALSEYFDQVLGFDISEAQLAEAEKRKSRDDVTNVTFKLHNAEEDFSLDKESVDLVISVVSAHWLNLPKFYANVDKVLRHGGVVAVVDYYIMAPAQTNPNAEQLNQRRQKFFDLIESHRVKEYDHRRIFELIQIPREMYPYHELLERKDSEMYHLRQKASLDSYLGFIRSLSYFQRTRVALGHKETDDLLEDYANDLKVILGQPTSTPNTQVYLDFNTDFTFALCRK